MENEAVDSSKNLWSLSKQITELLTKLTLLTSSVSQWYRFLGLWLNLTVILLTIGMLFKVRKLIGYLERRTKKTVNQICLWMRVSTKEDPKFFRFLLSGLVSFHSNWSQTLWRCWLKDHVFDSLVDPFFIITGYFSNLNPYQQTWALFKKPMIIERYADIIVKENLTLLFVKTVSDYKHLRVADTGSVEIRFWTIMTIILLSPQFQLIYRI